MHIDRSTEFTSGSQQRNRDHLFRLVHSQTRWSCWMDDVHRLYLQLDLRSDLRTEADSRHSSLSCLGMDSTYENERIDRKKQLDEDSSRQRTILLGGFQLLGLPTIIVPYSLNDCDQLSRCKSIGMHDLSVNEHFQVLNCDLATVAIDPNGNIC